MEEKKNNDSIVMKIDITFYNLVKDFIKRFEEKYKVKPSPRETTKIIAEKINSIGGLKVN